MRTPVLRRFGIAVLVSMAFADFAFATSIVDGITFAGESERIYVPLSEVANALHWETRDSNDSDWVLLNRVFFRSASLRQLLNGTKLISLADLALAGATVSGGDNGLANVSSDLHRFTVRIGKKRAVIDIGEQRLRAWQGDRLVLESRVSTGRGGRITPRGHFSAGPYKARMHRSHLYDNAPMPWSVQVTGNVFIHGFSYVPDRPASHGCIRVPLDEGNPAKWFYQWVDVGTPIDITGQWRP